MASSPVYAWIEAISVLRSNSILPALRLLVVIFQHELLIYQNFVFLRSNDVLFDVLDHLVHK